MNDNSAYTTIIDRANAMKRAYVASPLYHRDEKEEAQRAHDITAITARLISTFPALSFFTPVGHTYPMQEEYDAKPLYGWYPADMAWLDVSDILIVAMMDGWAESKGVNMEIKRALELGIPIYYLKVYQSGTSIACDLDQLHRDLCADECIVKMRHALSQMYSIGHINESDDRAYGEAFKEFKNMTGRVPKASDILCGVWLLCNGIVDGEHISDLADMDDKVEVCRNPQVVLKGFGAPQVRIFHYRPLNATAHLEPFGGVENE